METRKEQKALLAKLNLLAEIMNLHEWRAFGSKEAEDVEKAEAQIDSEASGSTSD